MGEFMHNYLGIVHIMYPKNVRSPILHACIKFTQYVYSMAAKSYSQFVICTYAVTLKDDLLRICVELSSMNLVYEIQKNR